MKSKYENDFIKNMVLGDPTTSFISEFLIKMTVITKRLYKI